MSLPTQLPLFQNDDEMNDNNVIARRTSRNKNRRSLRYSKCQRVSPIRRQRASAPVVGSSAGCRRPETHLFVEEEIDHSTSSSHEENDVFDENDDEEDLCKSPCRSDLIGYNRPPAVFRKTWTPLASSYAAPRWGSVELKKTNNGRRVKSGIMLESPISPKQL